MRQLPHSIATRVLSTSLLLLGLIVLHQRPAIAQAEKPNIVYIMADELGYYELSHMGNPHIKTPNIDRMAATGMRFTQGLAGSSVCAPTRCVLMTGKHSGHTSVRVNGGGTPLRSEEATIASMLKEQGYATGGFGKWGCGGRGSTGIPEKHGFDEFVGYYDQVHAHSYYPKYIVRNSEELPLKGNKGMSTGETYSHYVIVEHGMNFIRRNKDKPFFCYLPITPPHGLFDIPDSDPAWAKYKDKDWPDQAKRYAAMVTMVDRQVGDVFKLLEELRLDKNTLVVFCGDNGGNDYFVTKEHKRGFFGANKHPQTGIEFRGRKGTLYEGGLRIPMIAKWPGRIAEGKVSDHLWYFPDVLPTIAEITGAKPPADIDGISIVPELFGTTAAGREQQKHEYLYWELGSKTAVRWNDWKAVRPSAKADWELYDLSKDISEANDLAAAESKVLATIKDFAEAAHVDAVEGTFHDRAIHERDRLAKFGDFPQPQRRRRGKNTKLPQRGLIPTKDLKIVRVSSQADGNDRSGASMIDGDSRTHWHTQFNRGIKKHPHEVVIDLGQVRTVKGVRYMSRQDSGWNGALAKCELAVSDSADTFPTKTNPVTFRKTREPQEARFNGTGRYLHLRILSEVNNGPWASIAELGVIGQ